MGHGMERAFSPCLVSGWPGTLPQAGHGFAPLALFSSDMGSK